MASYKQNNAIVEKSEDFALRIVNLYKFLRNTKKESVISKQVLRSGTSIGANVAEAQFAQSKRILLTNFRSVRKKQVKLHIGLDYFIVQNF